MEGDAGTRQLNPTDAEDAPEESVAVSEPDADKPTSRTVRVTEVAEETGDERRSPSRWAVAGWSAICAALLALTAAAVVGGVPGVASATTAVSTRSTATTRRLCRRPRTA